MKLFKVKPPEKVRGIPFTPPVKVQDILGHARAHQDRISGSQKKNTTDYSKTRRLFLLALLIAALGAYNVWLLIKCFYEPVTSSLNIRGIAVPLGINPFKDKWFDGGDSEAIQQQVMGLKSYLDSLSLSADGKAEYQRILTARPGLMDSLRLFESMYNLQHTRPPHSDGLNTNPKK
jgi:hypothetical protein